MELKTIRDLFNTAHKDKNDCHTLIETTKGYETALVQAYHAAALMVSTKYILNPFISMKTFNQGKSLLEKMIAENKDNVEIHYLRYTIQMNAPRFIGYYKNKAEDREMVLNYLKIHKSDELCQHMLIYLLDTKDLTAKEEKSILN